jgi:hypothetical protein
MGIPSFLIRSICIAQYNTNSKKVNRKIHSAVKKNWKHRANTEKAAAPQRSGRFLCFISVNGMFAERLHQRTVFIRCPDEKRLPASRRNRCERPHVPDDDVTLPVVQTKPRFGVFQRRAGMSKAMQTLSVPFFMPVIKKKIVKNGAPHKTYAVDPPVQLFAEPQADVRYGDAVFQGRNLRVLDELVHGADILLVQENGDVLPKQPLVTLGQLQNFSSGSGEVSLLLAK